MSVMATMPLFALHFSYLSKAQLLSAFHEMLHCAILTRSLGCSGPLRSYLPMLPPPPTFSQFEPSVFSLPLACLPCCCFLLAVLSLIDACVVLLCWFDSVIYPARALHWRASCHFYLNDDPAGAFSAECCESLTWLFPCCDLFQRGNVFKPSF